MYYNLTREKDRKDFPKTASERSSASFSGSPAPLFCPPLGPTPNVRRCLEPVGMTQPHPQVDEASTGAARFDELLPYWTARDHAVHRPHGIEPHVAKRRPKPYILLGYPRSPEREAPLRKNRCPHLHAIRIAPLIPSNKKELQARCSQPLVVSNRKRRFDSKTLCLILRNNPDRVAAGYRPLS